MKAGDEEVGAEALLLLGEQHDACCRNAGVAVAVCAAPPHTTAAES
jgi:hypothetical protein